MIIVIWTDESGDDILLLEPTIEMCRKRNAMVVVVGPSAVLGSDRGTRLLGGQAHGLCLPPCRSRGDRTRPARKKCCCPTGTTPSFRPGARTGRLVAAGMPWYGRSAPRGPAVRDRALGPDALGAANGRDVYAVGPQGGPGSLQARES